MNYDHDPVHWTLPMWAAELVRETLRLDSESSAFKPRLRTQIATALRSIAETGISRRPETQDSGFDLFRLSKSKAVVDISSNTLRAYNKQGLPFYHRGKAIFVSKSELASFIRFAPTSQVEGGVEL
jgi:hypothetical protein